MFKSLSKLRRIYDTYDSNIAALNTRIDALEKIIRERTETSLSVNYNGNYLIAVGAYKGKGYVETYRMDKQDFNSLILQLKEMQRYSTIRTIDAPPQMRAVYEFAIKE